MSATALANEKLSAGLRTWAQGLYSAEAAVELLIAHSSWLGRRSFRESLWVADDVVSVDWDGLAARCGGAPASRTEHQVLQIALGLAGEPTTTPIGHLVDGLDATNTHAVLTAIAHCAGLHERHNRLIITGTFAEERR